MMIFAAHNLTRDPPFTRMHLVTCRNLLIYMQPQLQQQVLSTLHFALQPKGVLFLGSAETVGDLQGEFGTLHQKWKIFEKKREVRLPLSMVGGLLPRAISTFAAGRRSADAGLGRRLESHGGRSVRRRCCASKQSICVLVSANHEAAASLRRPVTVSARARRQIAAGRDEDGPQVAGPAAEHGPAPARSCRTCRSPTAV